MAKDFPALTLHLKARGLSFLRGLCPVTRCEVGCGPSSSTLHAFGLPSCISSEPIPCRLFSGSVPTAHWVWLFCTRSTLKREALAQAHSRASAGLVVSDDLLGLPIPQEESEMNRDLNVCPTASCDLSEMLGLKVLFLPDLAHQC